jgi:hypothetical protein
MINKKKKKERIRKNMSSQQQTGQKKIIYCKNGCGAQIKFSKYHRTENQGWIPLNTDGTTHECPMKEWNKKQQKQQKQQPQQQQQPVANQLTMGNKNIIIEAQLAVLADKVAQLSAKIDSMTAKLDALINNQNQRSNIRNAELRTAVY